MNLQQVWGFFFLLSLSLLLPPSPRPPAPGFALLRFGRRSLLGGSSAVVARPQSVCHCHSPVSLEMSYLINTPQAISHLF